MLGQYIASMHPDKIKRLIIDGVYEAEDYRRARWATSIVDVERVPPSTSSCLWGSSFATGAHRRPRSRQGRRRRRGGENGCAEKSCLSGQAAQKRGRGAERCAVGRPDNPPRACLVASEAASTRGLS